MVGQAVVCSHCYRNAPMYVQMLEFQNRDEHCRKYEKIVLKGVNLFSKHVANIVVLLVKGC